MDTLSYVCHKLGSAIFLSDPCVFGCMYLLRKGAYRAFLHIILKGYTISNKLVSKVFAQKKGEKSYDSSNMCSNFGGFR